MQINDYLGEIQIHVYQMYIPKTYQFVYRKMKWFPFNKRIKKDDNSSIFCHQLQLDPFIYEKIPHIPTKFKYFNRFHNIPSVVFSDFAENIITKKEWDMFNTLPKFTGFFDNLFELNNLSYFDDLQEELSSLGADFRNIFLHDIIAFELLRRQLGYKDYSGLEKMSYFLGDNPLKDILRNSLFFPTAANVSFILKQIPSKKIMNYFNILVKEAISLRIIVTKILVFDGQFVHSNCNDNKNKTTGQYNDPEAEYYRHTGKKLGVGCFYWSICAYCGSWSRSLPVHFNTFPGNKNDKPASRKTFLDFKKKKIGKWKMILGDTGTYCKRSLDLYRNKGIFPLLRAPKHLKTHPTLELKKGFWFNSDYFPSGWKNEDVLKMYDQRPSVEAGQSSNPTFYNQKRLNTRGIEMAHTHRTFSYILDLLRPLTAYKINRPDLLTKLSAFSISRGYKSAFIWRKIAYDSNFDQMDKYSTIDRHNSNKYRFKKPNGRFCE